MKKNLKEVLEKRNLIFMFIGYFFVIISSVLINFFLPFYLKDEGLNILEIGFLFTIGIAFGGLIVSLIFSKIQQKIKLKSGLNLSSFFYFLYSFIFFIIPNSIGVVLSNIFGGIAKPIFSISNDVTMQHNSNKKNHRKVSEYSLIISSAAIVFGLVLSFILIKWIGFIKSTLIFSSFALLSLFFFKNIKEETRFNLKNYKNKLPKINNKLKLILLSEILYWLGLGASFSLVITFLVTDYLSGSIGWIAILFIVLYSSMTITTLVTKKIMNRIDLFKSSIFGMILLFLSALCIIFSRDIYFVLAAMILEGMGAGIWVPSKIALYWGQTKPELREVVSGYLTGMQSFVSTIGPLVGGALVFYLGILAPFYFKAIIAFISLVIYIYLLKSR